MAYFCTMRLSRSQQVVAFAFNKGYRVIDDSLFRGDRKLLVKQINRSGYPYFTVYYDRSNFAVPIHRLAAYQKYGTNLFKEGIMVRHLNGDKLDYNLDLILIVA